MSSDRPAAETKLEATAAGLAAQESDRAADILRSILADDPGSLSALRKLARLLMRQSRFEEARPHWERISALTPHDGESRMALGRIHAHASRVLDALDRLGEVLQRNPGHAEAQRLRSTVGRKEIAAISARIDADNAAEFEPILAALEERLADDPHLQRLRIYSASLAADPRDNFRPLVHNLDGSEPGDPAFADPFEDEPHEFLKRLNAVGDVPSLEQLDEFERKGVRIAAQDPRLAKAMAQAHVSRGNIRDAIEVYRRLPAGPHLAQMWMEAASLAGAWGQTEALIEFCTRAARAFDADKSVIAAVTALLTEAKAHDAAIALLRDLPGYHDELDIRRRLVRVLFESGRDCDLIEEVHGVLGADTPFGALPEHQLAALVEILRRLRKSAWRARCAEKVTPLFTAAQARHDGSAIANWILGMLASARLDMPAAHGHFEEALDQGHLPKGLKIDLHAEVALLHERFHHFGEAYDAIGRISDRTDLSNEYSVPLQRVRRVVDFCGWQKNLRYPECLIDVIFEEIGSAPISYEPRENRLLTVSSSLRPGGGERQTVTVIGKMAADPRLERVVLAIRSMDHEDRASFLHAVRKMPIEIVHFGQTWNHRTDLRADLPQLAERERLAGAIDLLPHNLREDIVRLCKLILGQRPQAVHLRQDLFAAAIACALAGVPRFIVHRGSLSPNLWGHGLLETNLFLRPMRHSYRHLLSNPGFAMVNNSMAGAESDRAWTEWPDPSPFRVIYNAIEFEKLDRNPDPGIDLRAEAGVPGDAFLVGGIFRIEAVKRPMLWIETASLIASACPSAHFIVLGGGAMAQRMRDYARARGFEERLHMPGFVSNVGGWLRTIDLNLLTSDREGLPNVLIEGQHFGVPAVSSDVGGALETVEPGVTGQLVPVDAGADAFANAVLRIIADTAWRESARVRAPVFVNAKFGVDRAVDELLACLRIGPS